MCILTYRKERERPEVFCKSCDQSRERILVAEHPTGNKVHHDWAEEGQLKWIKGKMNGNYTTNDNFNIHSLHKGAIISCSRSTGLPQFKMFCLHCLSADYRGSICMLFFSISMFILLIYGMIQTFIIRVVAFSILRRYYNFRLFSFWK